MNKLKTRIAVLAAALMAFAVPASATSLTDGSGKQLPFGAGFTAVSEGLIILHPPMGAIDCKKSHFGGKTTNEGGIGVNVNGNIEALSWTECNALVTVLKKGSISLAFTSGNNATLTSTGTELTTEYLGFHCVYGTNNTKLGTLTGGTPATLDIESTVPKVGGRSGFFCSSTYQWTGSYAFTSPTTLNIDP